MRLPPAIAVLACVAAFAAACGGGSATSGNPPDISRVPTATMPAELPEVRVLGEGVARPDGGATYTIQSGDTLLAIAERFGIALEDLVAANPDVDSSALRPGEQINLPGPAAEAPPPEPTPEPPTPEPPAEEPTPEPATGGPPPGGTIHVVQDGEIPLTIAEQYGITVEELLAANPGINPRALNIGQELVIPPPAGE